MIFTKPSSLYPAARTTCWANGNIRWAVAMVDFILEQQARGSEALYPVIRMHFMALVSYLATQYDVRDNKTPKASALSRALAFMERNLEKPIRLSDVADSVFRAAYGITPSAARKLLLDI